MEYKRNRKKIKLICVVTVMSMISGLFAFFAPEKIYGYDPKTGIVQVDDVLNVRTGPGTSYARLTYNGQNVQLTNGYAITITGEAYATDGSKWYQIEFDYNNSALSGYVHSNYVNESERSYTSDGDFETYLTKQGFPEDYKVYLRQLHAKYPNWVFEADHLDYDWNTVVQQESVTGRSLISKSSISSWKSTETDAYNWQTGVWYGFDGGSWAAASKELVAYALDPRNFLNENYIFQFEALSYQPAYQTEDGLVQMLAGTFMARNEIADGSGNANTYAKVLMDVAAKTGVSPFCLAASIIQEQGSDGTGKLISGTVSGYEGYYNYFNWGAYASGGNSAVINGLIYAKKTDSASYRPWNTRYKSILGGATLYGKSYILAGQDTIYYKKFDFVGIPYTHQYMTHIIAARDEGRTTAKGYSDAMKSSLTIVFKIPVYKNMPSSVCPMPVKDGSPNNILSSLTVSKGNMTQSFDSFTQQYDVTVENSVSSITVNATAVDGKASVSGTGTHNLSVGSNRIDVTVVAENGTSRVYTIYVNRKASANTNTDYKIRLLTVDENAGLISALGYGTTAENLLGCVEVSNGNVVITDEAGKEKSGVLGTGDKVRILNADKTLYKEFQILLYGDVNGDGELNVKDAYLIRKDILGTEKLSGVYAKAADVNKGNDGITIKDAYMIKKHILGQMKITQ